MQEKIAEAWRLFDIGEFVASDEIYQRCLSEVNKDDYDTYSSVLMGLIYTQSFQEKYDEARNYAEQLIEIVPNEEELHIALHQAGMVERMAGQYEKAMELFCQEEAVIHRMFPDDDLRIATNLYEQAYVNMKMGYLDFAEQVMMQSLEHAKKAKDAMCIGCAYRGLGEIMNVSERTELARDFFESAMKAFKETGDDIAVKEVEDMLKKIM